MTPKGGGVGSGDAAFRGKRGSTRRKKARININDKIGETASARRRSERRRGAENFGETNAENVDAETTNDSITEARRDFKDFRGFFLFFRRFCAVRRREVGGIGGLAKLCGLRRRPARRFLREERAARRCQTVAKGYNGEEND